MATATAPKTNNSNKGVRTLENQSVNIKEVRPSAVDASTIILVLEPNEFVPDGIVKLAGKSAMAQLVLNSIPFADIKQSRAVGILADMASTAEPCKLQFDASYGVEGQEYTKRDGTKGTFTKTGVNLLNERIVLSNTAVAYRNKQQDKLDMLMVNASAKAEAEIKAELEADKALQRKTSHSSAGETAEDDDDTVG